MPDTGRIDHRITGAQSHGFRSVRKFLVQGDFSGHTEDQFFAFGMHFPAIPGLRKTVHADQSTFDAVRSGTLAVAFVPGHVREGLLDKDFRTQTQMYGVFFYSKDSSFHSPGPLENLTSWVTLSTILRALRLDFQSQGLRERTERPVADGAGSYF